MIVTDLEHATGQIALTPPMERALAFLQQARGRELEIGRIEIDRDRVYALVQAYETAFTNPPRFEAHRKYIDVHYIVSGVEGIGWAPTQFLRSPTAYDEPGDVWFGMASLDEATSVLLHPGQIAVFYPTDAHAPKLAIGQSVQVKKIVVKVSIEPR